MNINYIAPHGYNLLPYNGSNIEFLAKNMGITRTRVFDVLAVIILPSDELIEFFVNERVKNRGRVKEAYTDHLYRPETT